MRTVAVIGGGASGMMAAVTAAQNGADVTLIEHGDRIGRKILSTGNGRCNFTNVLQEPFCYHSDDPEFPWRVVEKFDARSIIAFFLQIGVYSKKQERLYLPPFRSGILRAGRSEDGDRQARDPGPDWCGLPGDPSGQERVYPFY